MFERLHLNNLLAVILLVGLASCNYGPRYSTSSAPTPSATTAASLSSPAVKQTPTATPSPVPTRLLTICLGREPSSLFLYDATTLAAQDVLAAIYAGPVEIQNGAPHPVIIQQIPSLANGDARLQPVEVNAGDLVVDNFGQLIPLEAGVAYRPSGCTETACAQNYSGEGAVKMDQLVLHFELIPGLQWSDGEPLTSEDSVFSFEVAHSLLPAAQSALINRTASYKYLDETDVEWVGVPGYQDGPYQDKLFSPLPQHAWSGITPEQLHTSEISARKPIGWGPYIIDEWVSGDHISLHRNPRYFLAGEGLPRFDSLVYRFVPNGDEALAAVQAGECDLVDQTVSFTSQDTQITELQAAGKIQAYHQNDAGWELLAFGITPLDPERPQFFAVKEVRQAVALCIDRQALVADQPGGSELLLDSYVPHTSPFYDPQLKHYPYDPQAGSAMLEAAGWMDADGNPDTARVAQGVSGVLDGTSFEVTYLVSGDAKEQLDAEAIQGSLQKCGISTRILTQDTRDYLAPGPEGPVFGRAFDLAQFAWASTPEPPCYLFLTSQVPGPYPEFPLGWGGANAEGYSNPLYDQACQNALYSLPDAAQHTAEFFKTQEIFAEDLPVLPLYVHDSVIVSRSDMCHVQASSTLDSALWYLEELDYGSDCTQ